MESSVRNVRENRKRKKKKPWEKNKAEGKQGVGEESMKGRAEKIT